MPKIREVKFVPIDHPVEGFVSIFLCFFVGSIG
jgi:hypothetical protein